MPVTNSPIVPNELGTEFDIGLLVPNKITIKDGSPTQAGKLALTKAANYPSTLDTTAASPAYVAAAIAAIPAVTVPDPLKTVWGILNNASGAIPGGNYNQGDSGQITALTTISNPSTTRTMRLVIVSAFARIYNGGSNTATIGAQGKIKFGTGAEQSISFAGTAAPNGDVAGGTFMSAIPTYDIAPGGSVAITNIAEWAVNGAGAINGASTIVQSAATYTLYEI